MMEFFVCAAMKQIGRSLVARRYDFLHSGAVLTSEQMN